MLYDLEYYDNLLENLEKKKILIVGDLMIDRYYYGDVNRISPESPVPIVNIRESYETLGGGGNVANNLSELGCRVYISGIIGNDLNGKIMCNLFNSKKIDCSGVVKTDNRTICKTRIIGSSQQMLRLDFEDIRNIDEMYENRIKAWLNDNIVDTDCVIISDYAKGVCKDTLCRYVIERCSERKIPVIVDPKGKEWNKYRGASFVTPNLKELSAIFGKKIDNIDSSVEEPAAIIKNKFDIENLLVTRSEKGMSLLYDSNIIHIPTQAKEVYDVSGAGDTVVSVLAAVIALGENKKNAVRIANISAGIAVSHKGTYAVKRDELLYALSGSNLNEKVLNVSYLKYTVAKLRQNNKKIVFTNGCFDILHRGHITYLKEAKELGDILIVGLNSDSSVKRLKGKERPINNQNDRALMLAAFEFVDYVIIFDADTPYDLISKVEPDILVKGGDYKVEDVVGREYAKDTVILPFVNGYSTTKIISNINEIGQKLIK